MWFRLCEEAEYECLVLAYGRGKLRVDNRRVLSGIIFVNRNGLRWWDAPREYGPHETSYDRWKRWTQKADPQCVMIDVTYLKVHRCSSASQNQSA
ncbi:transposase [Croceicoccus sp. BE223]|nr:transposase [Croceicoccus sp. BE223]